MKSKITLLASGLVIIGLGVSFSWFYNKGYSKAEQEAKAEHSALLVARLNEINNVWQEREANLIRELDKVSEVNKELSLLKQETVEVIRYVDRTIKVPSECRSLSNDVVRVLEQAGSLTARASRKAE